MRGTLSFNLPEEREEFELAINAPKLSSILWDVEQEVFRPARKHGYMGGSHAGELNKLLNHENDEIAQAVADAISFLEQRYYEIKNARLAIE